jgi:hypothetical protein
MTRERLRCEAKIWFRTCQTEVLQCKAASSLQQEHASVPLEKHSPEAAREVRMSTDTRNSMWYELPILDFERK